MVVESDYLSSEVNAAARKQELIRADNGVELARAQLSNALGVISNVVYQPAEALAERTLPEITLEQVEAQALKNRPDLRQLELNELAQAAGVRMAQAAFGPRVGAFGSWEVDNPSMFTGGANNWTAGIEVQFDLFTGGAKKARLEHEKAMQERLAALRESAMQSVRLEVRRAWYDADAARRQMEVARTAIAQSDETLRISQNRYDAGLTSITDLLRTEEAARRTRTDYWQAVYNYQTAYANLELATGTLDVNSPVVTR